MLMGLVKRVAIVAVIVVLGYIVVTTFFSGPQQPQAKQILFSDGFNELKEIWAKKGIAIDSLETDYQKIPLLSLSQLQSLESDLQGFKSSLDDYQYAFPDSKQAFVLLSDIYLDLARFNAKEKEIIALENQLSNIGLLEGCENISLFKEINSLRREKLALLKRFSANVENFVANHPAENDSPGFNSLELDFAELEFNLSSKENAVQSLEESC